MKSTSRSLFRTACLAVTSMLAMTYAGVALTAPQAQNTCVTPPSGMIGWWPGDGYPNDLAGTNHGTLQNGATFAPGKVGQGFSLDGAGRHVEVPDNPTLTPDNAITIDAWFKATPTGNYQFLVNKFDHNNGQWDDSYAFGLTPSNGIRFQVDTRPNGGNADNILEVAPPAGINPTDGNFHFMVGTYDGTTMRLYLDGVLAGSMPASGPINKTTKPLLLGAGMGINNNKSWFLRGLLDEVEVFDRALSESEAAALYAAGSAGKCKAGQEPPPGSCSTSVTVPGTSNPYLAGVPAGSTDNGNDSVPANSPVLVNGIPITAGATYTFSATGAVSLEGVHLAPPDGFDWYGNLHYDANGIGGYYGPANALLGVFLSDSAPNTAPAPSQWVNMYTLGFNNPTYSPALKQVFFIGDGKTSLGAAQTFVAPAGATRLYLATLDGYGWYNNTGSFNVTVSTQNCSATCSGAMTVPGTSNPWLAGMPAGSTAVNNDKAPEQSPALVSAVQVAPGASYTFEATGGVHYVGGGSLYPPDGFSSGPHAPGTENGIAPLTAPWNSLVGVFLDDSQPSTTAAPAGLNFSTAESQNYASLSPQLKQPFFIGDGLNGDGQRQVIVAPAGATRLFLGTMDGSGWYNNVGAFEVKINRLGCGSGTPPPSVTAGPAEGSLVGPGLAGQPGVVRTTFGGTGNAGCTIRATVNDPDHGNVGTYTTTVDAGGNWSMDFDLHDCDPTIEFVQVCGEVESEVVRRHIYVDGTPPEFIGGGPAADDAVYVGGSGTGTILIDGSAADQNTYHCTGPNCGGLTYEWHLLGSGGSRTLLGGGGSGGTLIEYAGGPGSGLEIDLQPGSYEFEVKVCDAAGNCTTRVCRRTVRRTLELTGGLPETGGIMGPGTGYTVVGSGGRVRTRLTGRGEPGCSVEVKISDPTHPHSTSNNTTHTVQVDSSGNWSLDLELDDCHPFIEIRQVCDGEAGEVIRRQVYIDTTPPAAGLSDQTVHISTGGTATVRLDPGAEDHHSHVPGNGLTYRWHLVGDGGRTPLCENCAGAYELVRGPGEYVIEVEITDSAGNVTTKHCKVVVLKRPTEIVCASNAVDFAGMVTLDYTLKDGLTGEVLARTLKYKLNGNEVPATFEAYLLPGMYQVVAEFAGDELYQSCSSNGGGCPLEVRSSPGKITGGGSIDERVRNFGFVVQTKSQRGAGTTFTGNAEFQDKGMGINLRSQTVTLIAVSADRRRGVFAGTATLNGASGYTFTVWIDDLAEPGAGVDRFRVQINGPNGFIYDSSTYATLEGRLDQGGNIQIHKAN